MLVQVCLETLKAVLASVFCLALSAAFTLLMAH